MRALPDPATWFTTVYRATYPDVLRYAKRRTSHPDDVVAETFTTAWRRVDNLPADLDSARAWLFGIARNTILNDRRTVLRKDTVLVHLDPHAGPSSDDTSDLTSTRIDLERAWNQLSPEDQEAVALNVLEGLDSAHAAQVMNISTVAYRHRLSRARARLRAHAAVESGTPTLAPHPHQPRFLPQESR